jgi:two-component system, NarL family, response regulator DesR
VLILLDRQSGAGVSRSLARLAPRVGFLGTETSPYDLVESVRQMARGEPVLDAEVAVAALTADENPLTDRECEVLRMALDGAPAKEIAQRLYLSAGTVRNYLSRILAKTGARSRIEAIRIAQDAGWI